MKTEELFKRVADDIERIEALLNGGSNVPLDAYISEIDVRAICNSFSIGSEEWSVGDLETLLLIRDALYEVRNETRDKNDVAEHSLEQLLSLLDRLYADVERAFRALKPEDVQAAHANLQAMRGGASVIAAHIPNTVKELERQAAEVIAVSSVSARRTEINFIKIENSTINVEVLRQVKIRLREG